MLCQPEDTLCAPCGAEFVGPSVALTFTYDFFDAVVLHTEFEVCRFFLLVRKGLADNACQPGATCTLPAASCYATATARNWSLQQLQCPCSGTGRFLRRASWRACTAEEWMWMRFALSQVRTCGVLSGRL